MVADFTTIRTVKEADDFVQRERAVLPSDTKYYRREMIGCAWLLMKPPPSPIRMSCRQNWNKPTERRLTGVCSHRGHLMC